MTEPNWIATPDGQRLLAQVRRVADGLERVADALEERELRRAIEGGYATDEQVDEAVRRGWIVTREEDER